MFVSLDVATTVCIFLIRGSNGGSFETCSNKVFLKFSWQNPNSYKVNRRAEYYTLHKVIDNFFAQSKINSQRLKLFCNNKEVDKGPFLVMGNLWNQSCKQSLHSPWPVVSGGLVMTTCNRKHNQNFNTPTLLLNLALCIVN